MLIYLLAQELSFVYKVAEPCLDQIDHQSLFIDHKTEQILTLVCAFLGSWR